MDKKVQVTCHSLGTLTSTVSAGYKHNLRLGTRGIQRDVNYRIAE